MRLRVRSSRRAMAAAELADRDAQINASAARQPCCSSARSLGGGAERRATVRSSSLGGGLGHRPSPRANSSSHVPRWYYGDIVDAETLFDRAIPALRRAGPPCSLLLPSPSGGAFMPCSRSTTMPSARSTGLTRRHGSSAPATTDCGRSFTKGGFSVAGRISDALDVLDEAIRLADRVGDTRWRSRLRIRRRGSFSRHRIRRQRCGWT